MEEQTATDTKAIQLITTTKNSEKQTENDNNDNNNNNNNMSVPPEGAPAQMLSTPKGVCKRERVPRLTEGHVTCLFFPSSSL